MFYTHEGYTEAPNGEKVENCQLLGDAEGETAKDALDKLLNENPWITACGFKAGSESIIARKLSGMERHLF